MKDEEKHLCDLLLFNMPHGFWFSFLPGKAQKKRLFISFCIPVSDISVQGKSVEVLCDNVFIQKAENLKEMNLY